MASPVPPLGAMFARGRARVAAAGFALAVVGLDLAQSAGALDQVPRFLIGVVAVLVAAHLAARDPHRGASLGLAPMDPAARRWWGRVIGAAALIVVAAIVLAVALARVRGAPLWPRGFVADPVTYAAWTIMVWPVYEECIYRLTLLPAAVALVGRRAGFVVGALAFAALHLAYGNLDPSNLFGSVVLPWAFLRTGSLTLAIGLHAGGNAAIVAAKLAMHYLA